MPMTTSLTILVCALSKLVCFIPICGHCMPLPKVFALSRMVAQLMEHQTCQMTCHNIIVRNKTRWAIAVQSSETAGGILVRGVACIEPYSVETQGEELPDDGTQSPPSSQQKLNEGCGVHLLHTPTPAYSCTSPKRHAANVG